MSEDKALSIIELANEANWEAELETLHLPGPSDAPPSASPSNAVDNQGKERAEEETVPISGLANGAYVEKEGGQRAEEEVLPAMEIKQRTTRPLDSIVKSPSLSKRDAEKVQEIWEKCRQLYLSVFFAEQTSVRSLGFTSTVSGEGKTFLAVVTAKVLANDTSHPVTLLECNWEHPCLHGYFGLPLTPGLAEWLRGECPEAAVRHQVMPNLTVIPAGNGKRDTVKLVQQMLQKGLGCELANSDELLIVDLPPILSTVYGSLAASIVESLVVVVRAQVTSEALVREACQQLKHAPIHGIVLNQMKSSIPRWLQQIL